MLTEDAIPVLYFIPQQLGYRYILYKTQIVYMYVWKDEQHFSTAPQVRRL